MQVLIWLTFAAIMVVLVSMNADKLMARMEADTEEETDESWERHVEEAILVSQASHANEKHADGTHANNRTPTRHPESMYRELVLFAHHQELREASLDEDPLFLP